MISRTASFEAVFFDSPRTNGDTVSRMQDEAAPASYRAPKKQPADDAPERGSRPPRQADFGVSAAKGLEKLESTVEEARREAETDPEKKIDQTLAEKRLELFLNEYDNAGAFKFKKFGREVSGFFEDSPEKPKVIETDIETGRLSLAGSEKNRRLMFVNMGELDRINKEGGGHAAGDAALKETVKAIERAVQAKIAGKEGRAASYFMLRYRGNEFMVSFDDISRDDFEEVLADIRSQRPKVEGVEEGAPLVADGFDFQEAIDIVNQVQMGFAAEERFDPDDPSAAAREFISVMQKRADWSLDVDKFTSRVGRVREKLKDDGPEAAKVFFDNYMKKMFQGTELEDLSKFEALTGEDIERMAFEHAGKYLDSAKNLDDARRKIIDARLKERREKTSRVGEYAAEIAGGRLGEAVPLAKVPELTRGQKLLDELGEKARNAEALDSPKKAEIARLDLQIEQAKRDKGTGLLERGAHYENLENAFKEGKEIQMVFVDMGFLRYFDNKGGSDVGNDAIKMAADLMERAIEASGVEGTAFRYGGDEFTVQISGSQEETAKFELALGRLRDQAGAIPAGKRGSADGYYPTELVFNYGAADGLLAESVFEDLARAGELTAEELADPDRVAEVKAEAMTVAADKAIEEQKAINRFMMLAEALRDPTYGTDPARKIQVDNLIVFSNKALFAEAGGDTYLRALAESGKDKLTMQQEVKSWVAERIKDSREKDGRKADLLSELVEVHGKIRYYERALSEARHEAADAKARNEQLAAALKRARDEREKLIRIRKTLTPE